jgi:hypothetical protein
MRVIFGICIVSIHAKITPCLVIPQWGILVLFSLANRRG